VRSRETRQAMIDDYRAPPEKQRLFEQFNDLCCRWPIQQEAIFPTLSAWSRRALGHPSTHCRQSALTTGSTEDPSTCSSFTSYSPVVPSMLLLSNTARDKSKSRSCHPLLHPS